MCCGGGRRCRMPPPDVWTWRSGLSVVWPGCSRSCCAALLPPARTHLCAACRCWPPVRGQVCHPPLSVRSAQVHGHVCNPPKGPRPRMLITLLAGTWPLTTCWPRCHSSLSTSTPPSAARQPLPPREHGTAARARRLRPWVMPRPPRPAPLGPRTCHAQAVALPRRCRCSSPTTRHGRRSCRPCLVRRRRRPCCPAPHTCPALPTALGASWAALSSTGQDLRPALPPRLYSPWTLPRYTTAAAQQRLGGRVQGAAAGWGLSWSHWGQ